LTEQEQIALLEQLATAVKEDTKENVMEQLAELAQQQLLWEQRIEMLTEKLATAKKQLEKVSGELIPQLLHESGLSEVRLGTGEKIIVEKGVSVTYKKEDQNKLFKFLKDNQAESLIKTEFNIGQVPDGVLDEIFSFLDDKVTTYETKMGVHSATLTKYVKTLTGIDRPDEEREKLYAEGRIKNIEELPEFLKVYVYNKTKIKK